MKMYCYCTSCYNSGTDEPVTAEGEELGEVESFVYLGSVMDKSGGIDTNVKTGINKAQSASNTLKWSDDRGKSAHPPR